MSDEGETASTGSTDTAGIDLVIVAAVDEEGVIGDEGGLPWHYPGDLRHFKETTMGHPVICGRRTYEGIVDRIGGPLPGRTNVVLSTRDLDLPDGAVRAGSVQDAIDRARDADGDVAYVIGGASVYEAFVDLADRMILTEINDTHEGDTYFPTVDWSNWLEVESEDHGEFSFVDYVRRS